MREKEEKILRWGKFLNRITLLIGVMTILLPVLFWKKIPDRIPMHSGADGVTDRMGDKIELILLFFVILFLMGVMSIVVYYIKSNAMSQYARAEERTSLTTIYPMVLWMNFFLMCGFAYMIFCAVTVRNLGKLFLPIFLLSTFAPLVFYLGKDRKARQKLHEEMGDYVHIERTKEGEVYRAHVDWWLGLLLGGAMASEWWILIEKIVKKGQMDWFLLVITLAVTVMILPLFFVKYILYPEHILVVMPVYGKVRIPYQGIVNMKETHNPLSSAAPSLDRIQIDYVIQGRHDMILISPNRKRQFMERVEENRRKFE